MFERSPALNETFVTVVGNLVDDPKLRTLEAGQDLASFRIASTSRRFDRDSAALGRTPASCSSG